MVLELIVFDDGDIVTHESASRNASRIPSKISKEKVETKVVSCRILMMIFSNEEAAPNLLK